MTEPLRTLETATGRGQSTIAFPGRKLDLRATDFVEVEDGFV